MAGSFICQEVLTGEESQRSEWEVTGYNRLVISANNNCGKVKLLYRRHVLSITDVN